MRFHKRNGRFPSEQETPSGVVLAAAGFEVLRASQFAFHRLQQMSAANISLNPRRNSNSSFSFDSGSGSMILRPLTAKGGFGMILATYEELVQAIGL